MHSTPVKNSRRLQLIVEILKDASRPLSSSDIYDASKAMSVMGKPVLSASAVGTCIGEIRDDPDHGVAGRKAAGKQYFEYWLTKAPGWTPRWTVNAAGVPVPFGTAPAHHEPWMERSGQEQTRTDRNRQSEPDNEMFCRNPACKKPIRRTHEDPLKSSCNQQCEDAATIHYRRVAGLLL